MRRFRFFLLIGMIVLPLAAVRAQVSEVSSVGFTVSDMDRAVEFYSKVLSFETISDVEVYGDAYDHLQGLFGLRMRVVTMKLGSETIELTDYLTQGGRPSPVDTKSNDLWFQHIAIVVSDMDQAYERLRQFNVKHVSTAPQTIPASNKAAAGIRAFYFRDPDDHNLELIYFPAGKGNPKWQNTGGSLFLGIDHTAIGIAQTSSSLKFYRDVLGMKLAGESFNYGTEQEHLNNVFGASLHISGLKASGGPGVEFLEYLAPRGGRPYPADVRADDLYFWQTTFTVTDLDAITKKLSEAAVPFISTGAVRMPDQKLKFKTACIVKDPDGHAVRLIEK